MLMRGLSEAEQVMFCTLFRGAEHDEKIKI